MEHPLIKSQLPEEESGSDQESRFPIVFLGFYANAERSCDLEVRFSPTRNRITPAAKQVEEGRKLFSGNRGACKHLSVEFNRLCGREPTEEEFTQLMTLQARRRCMSPVAKEILGYLPENIVEMIEDGRVQVFMAYGREYAHASIRVPLDIVEQVQQTGTAYTREGTRFPCVFPVRPEEDGRFASFAIFNAPHTGASDGELLIVDWRVAERAIIWKETFTSDVLPVLKAHGLPFED